MIPINSIPEILLRRKIKVCREECQNKGLRFSRAIALQLGIY